MQFVVRVYGILKDEHKRILVSDEYIKGKFYTKFPGGGLEFGEGTKECVVREFKEETGLDVEVTEHIYTTDFYQPSAFNPNHQIISIYYYVKANNLNSLKTSDIRFNFTEEQLASRQNCEVFRWVSADSISAEDVNLPIDKIVAEMIRTTH